MAPTDAGTGTNIPAALQDGSTLYRFPWPDEDNDTIEAINGRSMFRTLIWKVPATILAGFTHHELVPHVQDLQGGHGLNVWLPCPLSPGGIPYRTSGTPQPIVALNGERYQRGIPRTIFACGYCEKLFSVDADDLQTIRTALLA
ncbi:MAG: hypothetical protein HY613_09020, partial [Candidatus Rokubacteria bacterium]|nr:hypothetical protein [Candidatus Rokubacteria bacterium]